MKNRKPVYLILCKTIIALVVIIILLLAIYFTLNKKDGTEELMDNSFGNNTVIIHTEETEDITAGEF